MKKKDNVSEKLVEYIKQNNISIEQISKDTGVRGFKLSTSQISKDTGIWEKKLTDENVTFTASEFLELCSYLNVSPESFK